MSIRSFADLGVSRAVVGSLSTAGDHPAVRDPARRNRRRDRRSRRDREVAHRFGQDARLRNPAGGAHRRRRTGVRRRSCSRRRASSPPRSSRRSAAIAHARALRVTAVYGGVGLVKQAKEAATLARAGGDPRAPRGPAGARRLHARPDPDARPRRGRPDARHGLSPGDRPDRRRLSAEPPDAVLLRHPRRRGRPARRTATRAIRSSTSPARRSGAPARRSSTGSSRSRTSTASRRWSASCGATVT